MASSALQTTSEEAGEAQPLAQTTQFAPPADSNCPVWILTDNGQAYEPEYFYSDPEDARFTPCQPSGWAARPESQRFHFSPAVCPSGWIWHRIGLVSVTESANHHNITTAVCCTADFTPDVWFISRSSSFVQACILDVGYDSATPTTTTLSLATGPVSTVTSGVLIHEAWQITWRETDQAVLTPASPSLTGSTTGIFRWDGKATSIPDGDASTDNGSETGPDGIQVVALAVVLPISVVLLIGLFVFWSRWSLKKKAREAETSQAATN